MIVMGLMPELGALVESMPLFVLGDAGIVMFGIRPPYGLPRQQPPLAVNG
jgi:xanthine/uracil permease